MSTESIITGIAGWGVSYPIRWLIAKSINERDRKQIAKNIGDKNIKISSLNEAQKDYDRLQVVMKEFVPALIGISSIFVGLNVIAKDPSIGITALTFGTSHLVETYFAHRHLHPKIKGK